jgi:hypothetical protein
MLLQVRDIVRTVEPPGAWSLPPPRPDIRPACLTDLFRQIPEFGRALLPSSRSAITQLNRALKSRIYIPPSEETRRLRLYSSVALAVDRGALLLSGHDVVFNPLLALRARGNKVATRLAEALEVYDLPVRGIFNRRDVIGLLYVLGRLEPVFRGFRPLSDVDTTRLPALLSHQSVRQWLERIVAPSVGDEIVRLPRSLRGIRPSGIVYPNPIFGGLGPIIGSDGDWIADDTLVELKCTMSGMQREFVTQVMCYFALSRLPDRQNRLPHFSKLAVCLPRQSATVVGTVDEWLSAFGAPQSSVVVNAIHHYFSVAGRREALSRWAAREAAGEVEARL